jgi:hypothetical protein
MRVLVNAPELLSLIPQIVFSQRDGFPVHGLKCRNVVGLTALSL